MSGDDQERREALLSSEQQLMKGLFDAIEETSDESGENVYPVAIYRRGKLLFTFHIRPLLEPQFNEAKERHTRYERNRALGGIKVPVEVDAARFRARLIYMATTAEHRQLLWDNRDAWQKANVLNGVDLIDKVLYAGEKQAVIDKIEEISGFAFSPDDADNPRAALTRD